MDGALSTEEPWSTPGDFTESTMVDPGLLSNEGPHEPFGHSANTNNPPSYPLHETSSSSTEQEEIPRETLSAMTNHQPASEVQRLEQLGYLGFRSLEDAFYYLHFKGQTHIESVVVVEMLGPHNSAQCHSSGIHSLLQIPTHSHGYVPAKLPDQSPHARDVARFVQEQAAKTSAEASYSQLSDSSKGFGDWWMSQGGKFHMLRTRPNIPADQNEQQTETDSHMTADFHIDTPPHADLQDPFNAEFGLQHDPLYYAQPGSEYMLQDYKQNKPGGGTAKKSPKKTPDRHNVGVYQSRAFSVGTVRIWRENGIEIPPLRAKQHAFEHSVFSHAPFFTVDLRLLGDVYVTTHELLTWFPDSVAYWPDCADRFNRSLWAVSDMTKSMYIVRGLRNFGDVEFARMVERDRSRFGHYRARLGLNAGHSTASLPYADMTCANWQVPTTTRWNNSMGRMIDYYVSDLCDGVLHNMYPVNENAGPLTDVIRLVRDAPNDHEWKNLKLSGVSEFAKNMGLFRTADQAGLPTNMLSTAPHADLAAAITAKALLP